MTANDHRTSPRYLARPDRKITLGVTPKCGCSSVQSTLRQNGFHYTKNPDPARVVLVVRHPLERLVSAYYYFVKVKQQTPGNLSRFRSQFLQFSFPEFARFALEHTSYHWTPQAEPTPAVA